MATVPLSVTEPVPFVVVRARVAALAPEVVGVNVTISVQLAPGATATPQLLVNANWLALVPPRTKLVIPSDPLPVLLTART